MIKQFRLRNIDDDLIMALENIPTNEFSELARNGLRLILGIRTTRVIQVLEKPLFAPGIIGESVTPSVTSTIQSIKSANKAVWRPK